MDFSIGADINDAFASRMPLSEAHGGPAMGGPAMGGYPGEQHPEAVASPPVVLAPMPQASAPPQQPPFAPGPPPPRLDQMPPQPYPYLPEPAAYAAPGQPPAAPPTAAPSQTEGYFDTLAARRKDVLKLAVLALMVTLGIGVHSVLSHYTRAWIEAGDFSPKQEFLARLIYPAGVLFALWNLKALQ